MNRQIIKIYLGHAENVNVVVEAYHLDKDLVIKSLASCSDVKSSGDLRQPNMYPLAKNRVFLIF